MLSTRYVYLHEALGLGAMWLNQEAKIAGCEDDNKSLQETSKEVGEAATVISQQTFASKNVVSTGKLSAGQMAHQELLRRFVRQTDNIKQPETTSITLTEQKKTIYQTTTLSGSLNHTVKLLVLSVSASPADVLAGRLFSGEDGVLLKKMLAAIDLQEQDVYCTTWLGDELLFEPNPNLERVQAALPYLQNLYQTAGQPILLLLGNFFEQDYVIDVVKQMDNNIRYFVIAHPQRILSDTTLKRPTWTTLQQVQALLTN